MQFIKYLILSKISAVIIVMFCTELLTAQNIPTSEIVKSVQLDSIMVVAVKRGFSVEDFVELVKNDTTFYKAFTNIRTYPHISENNIYLFNKKQTVKASLVNKLEQIIQGDCRLTKTLSQHVTGDFFTRKGAYNYYTPEMFASIFWIKDTVCDVKMNRSGHFVSKEKHSGTFSMETHINQLKEFMFSPGAEVEGAPLVGKKLAIFDKKMARFYDYLISSQYYLDSIPCYVFTVKSKNEIGYFHEGKVVVDSLVTFFSRKNFAIVARKYYLSYYSVLFDFNVMFDIQLQKVENELFPLKIYYNGFWDIPFRKPEIAKFDIKYFILKE